MSPALRFLSPESSSSVLVLLALALAQLGAVCHSLKVSASIPELVKLNDAFWLNCSHHHQHQHHRHQPHNRSRQSHDSTKTETPFDNKDWSDIYAIKWYKDDENFYRFSPNDQPKVSIYETNGIQLDVSYDQLNLFSLSSRSFATVRLSCVWG